MKLSAIDVLQELAADLKRREDSITKLLTGAEFHDSRNRLEYKRYGLRIAIDIVESRLRDLQ